VPTITKKPPKTSRLLQAPRSDLEPKMLTMLDIFDSELALVSKKARDCYIEAAEKTARRYGASTETMRWAKVLILMIRLYRTGNTMAPREVWGDDRRQAEQFFDTHQLPAT
jgi:hypothetical protein